MKKSTNALLVTIFFLISFITGYIVGLSMTINNMTMSSPVAERVPHSSEIHNDIKIDYYHWLRDKNWPNVTDEKILNYLQQENNYADQNLSPALQETLFQEMKGRIKEEDFTVPYKDGDFYYYAYIGKDQQYWIHARKHLNLQEQILLNENDLALGQQYLRIAFQQISPNHNILAYAADFNGDERYTIYIKDLSHNTIIDEAVKSAVGDIAWTADSEGFFYTPANENWRTDRVMYHKSGTAQSEDILIYKEDDNTFSVRVQKSESEKFVFISVTSADTSEYYFIPSDQPFSHPKLIEKRHDGHLYEITHNGDFFYIRTNNAGPNFQVMQTQIDNQSQAHWQPYIAISDEYIESIQSYANHLVYTNRRNGLTILKYKAFNNGDIKEISFNDPTYEVSVDYTVFEDSALRYQYSSLKTPISVIEHDFITEARSILKTQEVPSGFNSADYTLQRLWATADDDTKIPVSVLYKTSAVKLDGTDKLYLYGYGSYGYSVSDRFRTSIFSLVDRGFIYAIAHIRGGDEFGKSWHEAAKFLTKKKTFTDFIIAAEMLIEQNYTAKQQIIIHGGSAGGMLVGACLNMRPDLYLAAIADVPFVDVLNTMLDESLPLTPGEFKEWGNPKEKEYYDYIKSYSPYDNVKNQNYPHILITAGLTDPRVTYWEPAKWAALLRYTKTDNNLLLLKTNMDAGHGGPTGRFDFLKEVAMQYSFILNAYKQTSE